MAELISPADYEEILAWHYEQEKNEDQILMRPTCAPHYYRIVPQLAKADGSKFKRRTLTFSTGGGKGCIAAQSICLIDCFSDVKPCSYFPLSAGNLKTEEFGKIWNDSSLFNELRDFKSYKGKCGSCEYLNVCGGCRARAYAVTGDYLDRGPPQSLTSIVDPVGNTAPKRETSPPLDLLLWSASSPGQLIWSIR